MGVAGVVAGGCTHLEVNPGVGTEGARDGFVYVLDYTQYDIVMTRELIGCKAGEKPKIKVSATVASGLAPDGRQVYRIDPSSMISAFKTSDLVVDYKDGRLVGFNASTVDRTGEVIASVASTAGKIAALSVGIPGFVDGAKSTAQSCSADAIAKLKVVSDNKQPLLDHADSLQLAQERLTASTAAYSISTTRKLAADIEEQKKAIKEAQNEVDTLVKAVTAAKAWLKEDQTLTWPESSEVFSSGADFKLSVAKQSDWFDTTGMASLLAPKAPVAIVRTPGEPTRLRNTGPASNTAKLNMQPVQFAADYPELMKPTFDYDDCNASGPAACDQLTKLQIALLDPNEIAKLTSVAVSFHLVTRGTYGGQGLSAPTGGGRAGIRYRVPAQGRLLMCEGAGPCKPGGETMLAKFDGPVAQLGAVFNIPFDSPAFASGGLGVTFDDQGRLLKAQLKRDSSTALGAAQAAGAVTDQMVAYAKARDGKELADLNRAKQVEQARQDLEGLLTKTPTELANEETAFWEAQQKLKTAREAFAPSLAKELTAEIESAKLQADLAEQKKRLAVDPNANLEVVRESYEAERAVFIAQQAAWDAEAASIRAARELAKVRAGQ